MKKPYNWIKELIGNDYNVMSLKITLFLVSFSLYLTINGFFFNDKTMHKIYKDNGVFNIIFQIPQILYSSIITSVINIILKNLSLSEKQLKVLLSNNNSFALSQPIMLDPILFA